MVGSSKILTVSYGTFSCTLEGFDDSFETMKSIAEYFRDLAAEDRHFGAEPPAPDAETLARLAQRNSARQLPPRKDAAAPVLRVDHAPAMPLAAQPQADILDAPAGTDADSVAAKLRRIRAVVGRGSTVDSDFSEDLTEARGLPRQGAGDDANPLTVTGASSAPASRIDDGDGAEESGVLTTGPQEEAAPGASTPDEVADDPYGVVPEHSAAAQSADADTGPQDAPTLPGDAAPFAATGDDVRDEASATTPLPAQPAGTDAPLVLRQAGTADDAPTDEDDLGDLDLLDAITDRQPDAVEGRAWASADFDDLDLTPEEEADLLAELAMAEREAATEHADAARGDHDRTWPPAWSQGSPRPGLARLHDHPEEDEVALSRILSETDAQLNEPESSRRRQAIAQLKAAVAATEAARRMGETGTGTGPGETAFRDDLRQVVRPRRAPRVEQRADLRPDLRSERPRLAPLKLVASQRIDLPQHPAEAGSAMPVRPRRISREDDSESASTADHPDTDERGADTPRSGTPFAAFAATMGARELPDLLEAAAAYAAFVEGIEDFSRPQIMKKVRESAPELYNREDGLRSFGTLLRTGRITKVSNGRFQVAAETRFRPERRVN